MARTLGLKEVDLTRGVVRPRGTSAESELESLVLPRDALRPKTLQPPRDAGQLLESEERFRLLAQATNDAVWDWDLVSETVWWSEGFEAHFGHWAPPGIGFDSWTHRIHPDDRERVLSGLHDFIEHGEGEQWLDEHRFCRADGEYVYVLDRGWLIRDVTGVPVRMIGGLTDITERRDTEVRLREQAALLDAANDAIVVTDLEGKVTYFNRAAVKLYGPTASQAVGKRYCDIAHVGEAEHIEATRAVLETGEWAGEHRHVAGDGTVAILASRWTLVRDGERPRAILIIATDVTEQRRLEQHYARIQRLESIGTLAGGIAHDLNNVLTPIILSIELLRAAELDDEMRETVDTVAAAARRGAEMVKQVLSFARGVEGRRVRIAPESLLGEVARIIRDSFPKNIQVESKDSAPLRPVVGDPTQLHQVLLNLAVNARDAMPRGGRLSLGAEEIVIDEHHAAMHPHAKKGRYVVFRVTDTGSGIAPDVRERIFEPFYTTKELGKGTGLGLSTALAIVRSHGGFMNVLSEPGSPTAFSVYLPADGAPCAEEPIRRESSPRGKNELVLFVDDEESIRALGKRTLETFGYRVVTASDGADAVAQFALNRGQISLVLTDMGMPVMDGLTTIRALKRIQPDVRVLFASGYGDDASRARAADAGVSHVLAKPYSADALLRAVREALDHSPADTDG